MDRRGLALADLTQEHIDDWIAEAASQRRYLIRYFLNWTASRRLTRKLTVPVHPAAGAPGHARRGRAAGSSSSAASPTTPCPPDVRAAGAITLLFGPSAERLCHLTPDHLKPGGEHDRLVLGRHPVLLPPRLPGSSGASPNSPRPRPQLSRSSPGTPMALPGHGPGQADLDATA